MKTFLFLISFIPAVVFSQTSSPSPKDSLNLFFFKKNDSVRIIPIPNKIEKKGINYFGMIRKSKGNAIEIPNKCITKPKASNKVSK